MKIRPAYTFHIPSKEIALSKLLIATNNAGKLTEYHELLQNPGLELLTLNQVGITEDIPETGHSFLENAIFKAKTCSSLSGIITLADDSGLEVSALGGAPGVKSKRYAGTHASDEERIRFLLDKLSKSPVANRQARLVCYIAISYPDGPTFTCSGTVEGEIASCPQGSNGFGYDPVFFIPSLGRTMAQLSFEEKNMISHRAVAAREASKIIGDLYGGMGN
jgi:XTP/dITP diphosphohydrolase